MRFEGARGWFAQEAVRDIDGGTFVGRRALPRSVSQNRRGGLSLRPRLPPSRWHDASVGRPPFLCAYCNRRFCRRRCVPVLAGNLTERLGSVSDAYGHFALPDIAGVGRVCSTPGRELELRTPTTPSAVDRHGRCARSSRSTQRTVGWGGSTSWIDYVCLLVSLLVRRVGPHALPQGRQASAHYLSRATRPRAEAHLGNRVPEYGADPPLRPGDGPCPADLEQSVPPPQAAWNQDMRAEAVELGFGRAPFVETSNEWAQAPHPDLDETLQRFEVDAVYDMLKAGMLTARHTLCFLSIGRTFRELGQCTISRTRVTEARDAGRQTSSARLGAGVVEQMPNARRLRKMALCWQLA